MTGPTPPTAPERTENGAAPTPFGSTPNAERYLLEADNLRRRQLRSALLHGSSRTWRDRRRIWPAVIAGIVLTAIIVTAIAVTGTFRNYQRQQEQEEREREQEQQRQEEEQLEREQQLEEQRREREEQQEGQAIAALPPDPTWDELSPLATPAQWAGRSAR